MRKSLLRDFRPLPRLGTHGRQSSGLLRIRPPRLTTSLPAYLSLLLCFLLCLLLCPLSFGFCCFDPVGLCLSTLVPFTQLTGIEFGVTLGGMPLANEKMVTKAGSYRSLLAIGAAWHGLLACVDGRITSCSSRTNDGGRRWRPRPVLASCTCGSF